MELRRLTSNDVSLIARIDRSEIIRTGYTVENGRLVEHDVMWDTPTWDPDGTGQHSVHTQIEHWRPIVERGAILLGAFDGDDLAGIAVVDPSFEDGLAWLAFLHVSNRYRRSGVASTLWNEAVRLARADGAPRMYVSATPSGSAVGFYLSKGCVLADPPHPALFADEPEDIHLVCPI